MAASENDNFLETSEHEINLVKSKKGNSIRVILLLVDGGFYILKKLLSRVLGSQELDALLLTSKSEMKHELHQMQLKKLYPSSKKTDINTWDLQMLLVVLLRLFHRSLTLEERKNLNAIKTLRNNVLAHSLDEEQYKGIKDQLKAAVTALASGFDQTTQTECMKLIDEFSSGSLDKKSTRRHLKQIKDTELFKELARSLEQSKQDCIQCVNASTSTPIAAISSLGDRSAGQSMKRSMSPKHTNNPSFSKLETRKRIKEDSFPRRTEDHSRLKLKTRKRTKQDSSPKEAEDQSRFKLKTRKRRKQEEPPNFSLESYCTSTPEVNIDEAAIACIDWKGRDCSSTLEVNIDEAAIACIDCKGSDCEYDIDEAETSANKESKSKDCTSDPRGVDIDEAETVANTEDMIEDYPTADAFGINEEPETVTKTERMAVERYAKAAGAEAAGYGNSYKSKIDWIFRKSLRKSLRILVSRMDPDSILDNAENYKLLTYQQAKDLRNLTTNSDKNRKIIDRVRERGQSGYTRFKECLKETNQSILAEVLECFEIEEDPPGSLKTETKKEMETVTSFDEPELEAMVVGNRCPVRQSADKILSAVIPDLVEFMKPGPILDNAGSCELLNFQETRDIKDQKTTSEKNRHIIDKVRQKGIKGYDKFKECLKNSQQLLIVELLECFERGEDHSKCLEKLDQKRKQEVEEDRQQKSMIESISENLKKLTKLGKFHKTVKVGVDVELNVGGASQELVDNIEQLLISMLNRRSDSSEEGVEELIRHINELIADLESKGTSLKQAVRKCIFLQFECSTYAAVLDFLHYTSSEKYQDWLEILAQLFKMKYQLEELNISSKIPLSCLEYLKDTVEKELELAVTEKQQHNDLNLLENANKTSAEVHERSLKLELECTSVDGITRVLDVFQGGKAMNHLNKISEALSNRFSTRVRLSSSLNLTDIENALETTCAGCATANQEADNSEDTETATNTERKAEDLQGFLYDQVPYPKDPPLPLNAQELEGRCYLPPSSAGFHHAMQGDNFKMEDNEEWKSIKYKNWLRGVKGSQYLQEGLKGFVGNKVVNHRDHALQKVITSLMPGSTVTCNSCTSENLLPEHAVYNGPCTRQTCIQQNSKKCFGSNPRGRRACPNGICGKLYDEIIDAHTFRDPLWKNTDPSTWCSDPAGWSYAKCFQTTPNTGTCSCETNTTGLLDIILYDKCFQSDVDCILISDPNVFISARNIGNDLLHSAKMELEEAHLQQYIAIFIAVLKDQKCLLHDQEAIQSVEMLEKLRNNQIIISLSEEINLMQVRNDALSALDQLAKEEKEVRKRIDESKQVVLKETEEAKSGLQDKEQEIYVEIKAARSDMQSKKWNILTDIEGAGSELQGKKRKALAEIKTAKSEALETINADDVHNRLQSTQKAIEKLTAEVQQLKKKSSSQPAEISDRGSLHSIYSRYTKTDQTAEKTYSQMRDQLKLDLIKVYRQQHDTIQLSPLIEKEDESLLDFYLEPDIIFVELKRGLGGCKEEKTAVKTLSDVFYKDVENKIPYKEIFITADAGLGKTSFCKRLALAWCHANDPCQKDHRCFSEDEINAMCGFDFVFLVLLRDSKMECDIIDLVGEQVLLQLESKTKYNRSDLESVLSEERCLVILDGLDEWTHPENNCKLKEKSSPHRNLIGKYTTLITTRPWKLSVTSIKGRIDKIFEISGLGKDSVGKLKKSVIKHITGERDEHKVNQEVKTFDLKLITQNMLDLAVIPIFLMFMLCSWCDEKDLGQTANELYTNIIEMLLTRAEKRIESKDLPKMPRNTQGILPKYFSEKRKCKKYYKLLMSLAQLAFETLSQEKKKKEENHLVFNRSVADKYLEELEFNFCLKAGILTQSKDPGILFNREIKVSFCYKSMQHFFADLYKYSAHN